MGEWVEGTFDLVSCGSAGTLRAENFSIGRAEPGRSTRATCRASSRACLPEETGGGARRAQLCDLAKEGHDDDKAHEDAGGDHDLAFYTAVHGVGGVRLGSTAPNAPSPIVGLRAMRGEFGLRFHIVKIECRDEGFKTQTRISGFKNGTCRLTWRNNPCVRS